MENNLRNFTDLDSELSIKKVELKVLDGTSIPVVFYGTYKEIITCFNQQFIKLESESGIINYINPRFIVSFKIINK